MIISVTIENWMSFRDKTHFSMVSSRERQHGERIYPVDKYKMRTLPVAAIFGGNASGKTNFFKALKFAQNMVVKGTQPEESISVEPFTLDTKYSSVPSRFSFEILIENVIYEFSFAVNSKSVLEEKLVQISASSERVLYERRGNKFTPVDPSLKDTFVSFIFKGTRSNQLFLTNTVDQNFDRFKHIFDWFKNSLVLIAPDARFAPFEQFIGGKSSLRSEMNNMLSQLDTGIERIDGEEIPLENLPFPDQLKAEFKDDLRNSDAIRLGVDQDNFLITKKKGKLIAKKMVTYHSKTDGGPIKFNMQQESDGTRRIIDLLPAFLSMSQPNSKKVYIIDEIGRSLHTLVIRKLMESFLSRCVGSHSQLLLTTHDVLLMDQTLLRRDEMWVTERNLDGSTEMRSFSDYKDVRYDKDIRKSYLQGRLGGIPRILLDYSSCSQSVRPDKNTAPK